MIILLNETNEGITVFKEWKLKMKDEITGVKINYKEYVILDEQFSNRNDLFEVIIPDKVTAVGEWAFAHCANLTNIILSENIKMIRESTFLGCINLELINMPKNIFCIQKNAFFDCVKLKRIDMNDGVIKIGESAFQGCVSLNRVIISKNIRSIGRNAFENCINLKDVYYNGTLYDWLSIDFTNVKTNPLCYGANLYLKDKNNNYYNLEDCIIPNEVQKIGESAFQGCINLNSIIISKNIKSIGRNAFENCTNLKDVYYNGTLRDWLSIDFANIKSNPLCNGANLYLYDKKNNYYKLEDCIISNGVQKIGQYVFSGCLSIKKLCISNSISYIGDYSFYNCQCLQEIILPVRMDFIGPYAFFNCLSLTKISMPKYIEEICDFSFYGCEGLSGIQFSPPKKGNIKSDSFNDYIKIYLIYVYHLNCNHPSRLVDGRMYTYYSTCPYRGWFRVKCGLYEKNKIINLTNNVKLMISDIKILSNVDDLKFDISNIEWLEGFKIL